MQIINIIFNTPQDEHIQSGYNRKLSENNRDASRNIFLIKTLSNCEQILWKNVQNAFKMSKVCKLWIHQANFSEEDLVLNPKDFQNGLKENDILQIYQIFEDGSSTCKLLLQIKSLQTDFQQKETISLKHSVANKFKFWAYWDVQVEIIDPSAFTLALVELTFKDQWVGRSDMWRFGKTLIDSAVYTSKKLSFAGARAEVHEMWASGETVKVTCGVVGKDTRVRVGWRGEGGGGGC